MLLQDSIPIVNKQIQSVTNENEMIEIYKEILNNQTDTYNLIIMVFLGIISVFALATWLYNKKIVKGEIEEITANIYKKEKKKLIKKFKREFKEELNLMKAENARVFILTTSQMEGYKNVVHSFAWCLTSIKYYNLISNGDEVIRISVELAIEKLKKINNDLDLCIEFYKENYKSKNDYHLEIIKSIPNILKKEKTELKKLFDDFNSKLVEK